MVKIIKRTLKQIFENEDSLPPTYDKDLKEYLKKYDGQNGFRFSGVILRDEVRKLKIHDKMFLIINYDKTEGGSHGRESLGFSC